MVESRFFLLFIFLKQFYIFPSGSIGPADLSLLVSTLCLMHGEWKAKRSLMPEKQDVIFWFFVAMTVLINGIYFVSLGEKEFLKFTLFWFYNGMFLWNVRRLVKKDEKILWKIGYVLKVNVIVQFGLWLGGLGRWFVEYNGKRYMGSFNDPNQLAFFLFAMMLMLYIHSMTFKDRSYSIFYVLSLWLIIQSKSTGIMVGALVLLSCIGILACWKLSKRYVIPGYLWGCGGILALFAIMITFKYLWPTADFQIHSGNFTMTNRIREKIFIVVNGGWREMLYNRGWDKLILYPQYLLYGAGEGVLERFEGVHFVTEVHNGLLNVLFCYGMLPTILLLYWICMQIKKADRFLFPAIFALLVEGCFLVNYRQPFFWWVLISGSIYGTPEERIESDE